MTLVASTSVLVPDYSSYGSLLDTAGITFTNLAIDAAAEKVAFVFSVPKDGNLARIGFRLGAVATGDTVRVSFQDVDVATGLPDGTADQFRTQAIAGTDANTWIRPGLVTNDGTDTGTKRAVTRGQVVCAVIEYSAFVAGNMQIHTQAQNVSNRLFGGYLAHFTAAWAKRDNLVSCFAIEYDDGSFGYIGNTLPVLSKATVNINTGTTPDEVALKFKLPVPVMVGGFWLGSAISGDFDMVLYDSDGTTPLSTVSINKDVIGAADGVVNVVSAPFSSSISLLSATFYRLALKPTSASNVSARSLEVPSTPGAAQLDQMSGGQNFHWSERTDAGAWTDTTTKRPVMGLILDGMDDGIAVGGVQSMFDNGIN